MARRHGAGCDDAVGGCAGKTDGLTWRVPSEVSVVGKTLKVVTDSVAQRAFTVEALMRQKDAVANKGAGGAETDSTSEGAGEDAGEGAGEDAGEGAGEDAGGRRW